MREQASDSEIGKTVDEESEISRAPGKIELWAWTTVVPRRTRKGLQGLA